MIILLFVLWTEKSRFPTESGTAHRHGHNRTTRRQTDRLLSAEDTYPSAQTAGFLTYGSPPGRAFSCLHNGVCGRLPAYSDRIVRDLHPIPFYPPRRAALSMLSSCRKTYYANFSPLSRGGALLIQEHPRRVCQGMRRSMLRRRRARWASSSVMPFRAISRSLARSTTSRSSRLRRAAGGLRPPRPAEAAPPPRRAAPACLRGRGGGGVQGAPAPAPAGRGGQQQHRAEAGQLPGQLLRRPIRELIAAHHGGEPLLANQALDLIRGAAEQAGGRPGALQQLLESPAVFSPSKATTTVSTGP